MFPVYSLMTSMVLIVVGLSRDQFYSVSVSVVISLIVLLTQSKCLITDVSLGTEGHVKTFCVISMSDMLKKTKKRYLVQENKC